MITDSHAHIYLEDFEDDLELVLANAQELGVGDIYMPNIDKGSVDAMHRVEDRFSHCKSMIGLHPCYVKKDYRDQMDVLKGHLESRKYAAVGEIGVDLYWDKTYANEQIEVFEEQIEWAKDHDLGVVIHSRDALDITIETIRKKQNGDLKGVFHCFNGTVEQGKAIRDLGFLIGIGGVVTYKNAGVAENVAQLSLDQMILETDSPYLSPGPKRTKRNDPSRIVLVLDKLEQILKVDRSEIIATTSKNCRELFAY